jgi:hypothetical protein
MDDDDDVQFEKRTVEVVLMEFVEIPLQDFPKIVPWMSVM